MTTFVSLLQQAVNAVTTSRQDDAGQLSSVELLALPARGQQALRSHDGKLILRMPAAGERFQHDDGTSTTYQS